MPRSARRAPPTPRAQPAIDTLPTAAALDAARRAAHRACADEAFALGWPMGVAGHAMMDRTGLVALAALAEVCPEAPREVLARCLKLDPHNAPALLDVARRAPGWPDGAVPRVAAVIIKGGC